jgi:hypothetical protein
MVARIVTSPHPASVHRLIGVAPLVVGIVCLAVAVWLLVVYFDSGLAVLAGWTNGIIVAAGVWLLLQATPTWAQTVAAASCAAVIIIGSEQVSYERRFNVWWQEPPLIEPYLRSQTPLGATEQQVVDWSHEHATVQPNVAWSQVNRATIQRNSDYPLSTTGGAAFIQSALHHEPRAADSVQICLGCGRLYTFDTEGRLVDVRVRITVNSL